jgi:hypothetical protein
LEPRPVPKAKAKAEPKAKAKARAQISICEFEAFEAYWLKYVGDDSPPTT